MRRTEQRQGLRMLKLRDVLGRWEAAELSQLEAAELLGMSERTFRRWSRRFEEEGEAGLVDRRLGKASGKRVPVDREREVEALYRSVIAASPPSTFASIWSGTTASAGATRGPRPICRRGGYWPRRRGAGRTGASGRAGRWWA